MSHKNEIPHHLEEQLRQQRPYSPPPDPHFAADLRRTLLNEYQQPSHTTSLTRLTRLATTLAVFTLLIFAGWVISNQQPSTSESTHPIITRPMPTNTTASPPIGRALPRFEIKLIGLEQAMRSAPSAPIKLTTNIQYQRIAGTLNADDTLSINLHYTHPDPNTTLYPLTEPQTIDPNQTQTTIFATVNPNDLQTNTGTPNPILIVTLSLNGTPTHYPLHDVPLDLTTTTTLSYGDTEQTIFLDMTMLQQTFANSLSQYDGTGSIYVYNIQTGQSIGYNAETAVAMQPFFSTPTLLVDAYPQTTAAEIGHLLYLIYQCSQGQGELLSNYPTQITIADCQTIINQQTQAEANLAQERTNASTNNTLYNNITITFLPNQAYILINLLQPSATESNTNNTSANLLETLSRQTYTYFNQQPLE